MKRTFEGLKKERATTVADVLVRAGVMREELDRATEQLLELKAEAEGKESSARMKDLERSVSHLQNGLRQITLAKTLVLTMRMPSDLCLHLSGFLDDAGLFECRGLCKPFRKAFFDQAVQRGTKFNHRRAMRLAAMGGPGRKFRNLQHLEVIMPARRNKKEAVHYPFFKAHLDLLPSAFPGLRSLRINTLYYHGPAPSFVDFPTFPNLTALETGIGGAQLHRFPNLQKLTIISSRLGTLSHQNLEELAFLTSCCVYGRDLEWVTRQNFPKLRSLCEG